MIAPDHPKWSVPSRALGKSVRASPACSCSHLSRQIVLMADSREALWRFAWQPASSFAQHPNSAWVGVLAWWACSSLWKPWSLLCSRSWATRTRPWHLFSLSCWMCSSNIDSWQRRQHSWRRLELFVFLASVNNWLVTTLVKLFEFWLVFLDHLLVEGMETLGSS